jgi:hypothetical protein
VGDPALQGGEPARVTAAGHGDLDRFLVLALGAPIFHPFASSDDEVVGVGLVLDVGAFLSWSRTV